MTAQPETDQSPVTPDGQSLASSACSAVVNSIVVKAIRAGRKSVLASTQYGMGFVLSCENEILFRDDSLSHAMRSAIADDVNEILKQNAERTCADD